MIEKIANDPLVQYLKKHAKKLEDNADALATHTIEPSLQDRESNFEDTAVEKKKKEDDELLKSLFSNYGKEKLNLSK